MLFKRILKVFSAADGNEIAHKIREYFAAIDGVDVDGHNGQLPDGARGVAVFVLTEESFQDPAFGHTLTECLQEGLPVVPVVPGDPQLFYFSSLPDVLKPIAKRNVLGWKANDSSVTDGKKVCEHIKAWLGLALFKRDRKLFISYRRSDGASVAAAVHDYLSQREYRVFLDTEDIAGGDVVQRLIHEAIFDRDFLLLVDSPEAADSKWIREEVETAILNRIKILVLRLPGGRMSLPPEITVFPYLDMNSLPHLEKLLQDAITAKIHFDLKVEDALDTLAETYGIQLSLEGTRKVFLTRRVSPRKIHNVLLHFEDAPHSLESLYRLYYDYKDYRSRGKKVSTAYFIHRSPCLSPFQKETVQWARRRDPLEIGTIDEFISSMV